METPPPLPLHKDPAATKNHFSSTKNAAGERAALHDITNDSPIVGLAAGGLHASSTPASTAAKTRPRPRRTPGSGEALLRGQVKTLLHKVHEEACAAAIRPARIHALLGVSRSPAQLLAPTPANTPQLGIVSAARDGIQEQLIPMLQVIAASVPAPEDKLGECQLNRALVFDDSPGEDRSPDDDSSSAWSVQVHPSDEDTLGELEEEAYSDDDDEEWQGGDDCFDDVCEGMSKMTVAELDDDEPVGLPVFEGKHTRFVYSSDEDLETETEQVKEDAPASI